MEETSNNANAHNDMITENINHHESQGSRNDSVQSHSEAYDTITPSNNTVSRQGYDAIIPPGISNNT